MYFDPLHAEIVRKYGIIHGRVMRDSNLACESHERASENFLAIVQDSHKQHPGVVLG